MSITAEQFKLLSVEIENFKNIKHMIVEIDGRSAFIIGGNGQGKSSLMDALLSPVDSKFIPEEPINIEAEEKRSIIRLVAGNQKTGDESTMYELNIVFTPKTKSGNVTLYRNGEQIKTAVKTKIKQIFGDISFDIYEFMKMGTPEKIKALKKLTGCGEKLDELTGARKKEENDRYALKKSIEEMENVNDPDYRPFSKEEIKQYEEPKDVAAIEQELTNMNPAIEKWNKTDQGIKDDERTIKTNSEENIRLVGEADKKKDEIQRLYAQIETLKMQEQQLRDQASAKLKDNEPIVTRVEGGKRWLEKNPKPDTISISTRLGEAREHNRMHEIIKKYKKRHDEIFDKKEELTRVEDRIKFIDDSKIQLIKESQLPVKGLLFDDEQIYLDGVPLESGQVNTARLMDVAAEISMALNPTLKLVMLREASLFDKEHLNSLIARLNERGYQWFAEIVDPDGGPLSVQFVEKEVFNG